MVDCIDDANIHYFTLLSKILFAKQKNYDLSVSLLHFHNSKYLEKMNLR